MRFQRGKPTVIFFDLDDTLIHEEATDRDVADEVAAALLVDRQLPPGALYAALHSAARSLWQQSGELAYCHQIGTGSIEGLYGDFSGGDSHLQAHQKYLQEIQYRERAWSDGLRALGIDDAALARKLAAAYAEARRSRHVQFPEALSTLQRLSRSFRLAMITNGAPRVQRLKLEGSGLAEFFDPVVISGELGVGKPDPSIFRYALEKVGVPAESALMVGNSLTHDVAGAQSAGIRAAWVNRDGSPPPHAIRPDLTVATLEELRPDEW